VAVIDELAGRAAGLGEAEEVNDTVEARLEELQKALARDTALALGDVECTAELLLEQTVGVAKLLLLGKAYGVFAGLAASGLRAVLARRECALLGSLLRAHDSRAEAAVDAGDWSCVTCHC
jgi:hypothetical protein